MAEIKEMNNETTINKEEQQGTNPAPEAPVKEDGKINKFFKNNGKKFKTAGVIVGAVVAGVAADRLGIKLSGNKKDDTASDTEA